MKEVVLALLENELRHQHSVMRKHLAPLLRRSATTHARRGALDSISLPLAVLLHTLEQDVIGSAADAWYEAELSANATAALLPRLRIVRDKEWDNDIARLHKIIDETPAIDPMASDVIAKHRLCTAGSIAAALSIANATVGRQGKNAFGGGRPFVKLLKQAEHFRRVLRMAADSGRIVPDRLVVLVPDVSEFQDDMSRVSDPLSQGRVTLIDGNHRSVALAYAPKIVAKQMRWPLRIFVCVAPRAERWRHWRECHNKHSGRPGGIPVSVNGAPLETQSNKQSMNKTSWVISNPVLQHVPPQLHLLIFWSNMRDVKRRELLSMLSLECEARGLRPLRPLRVSSSTGHFDRQWFQKFYGKYFYEIKPEGIVKHKGAAPFTLLLLRDESPSLIEDPEKQRGLVSAAMLKLKTDMRKLIAPNWWQIHATVTPLEAENDIQFMFGQPVSVVETWLWGGMGISTDMEAPLEVVFSHEVGHVTHSHEVRQ
eukprot:g2679.t1